MNNNHSSMPNPRLSLDMYDQRCSDDTDLDRVTILAHDLRNYLSPAYAHLTALYARAQREDRDIDMRAAARSKQALDHALSLTDNLLEVARVERGLLELNLQPLNLTCS